MRVNIEIRIGVSVWNMVIENVVHIGILYYEI